MTVLTRKLKPLYEEHGKGSQDLTYEAVYSIASHWPAGQAKPVPKRVRIRIRRDSYDFQSYALAEVWSVALDKWEVIASIHYSQMISLADTYHSGADKMRHHMGDVEILLRRAQQILGGGK